MSHRLGPVFRFWRLIATGLSYTTFMAGGFLMAMTVFPVVRAWPGSSEIKQRRVRRLIQSSFIGFLKFMVLLRVMHPPMIKGLEHPLRWSPCLIIANHPTLIDVVLLISLLPDCNCVVKRNLWDNAFIGGVVRAAGYVPNDEGPALIKDCVGSLDAGNSLIIFPEGTRSPEREMHSLNRGAARIALRAAVPVVPAVITCSPPTLMKHQRWYEVPVRLPQIAITFHPALVFPAEVCQKEELPRQARALTAFFELFLRSKALGE